MEKSSILNEQYFEINGEIKDHKISLTLVLASYDKKSSWPVAFYSGSIDGVRLNSEDAKKLYHKYESMIQKPHDMNYEYDKEKEEDAKEKYKEQYKEKISPIVDELL